jgi:hypothetical protein
MDFFIGLWCLLEMVSEFFVIAFIGGFFWYCAVRKFKSLKEDE